MKNDNPFRRTLPILALILALASSTGARRLFAEVEIDLEDVSKGNGSSNASSRPATPTPLPATNAPAQLIPPPAPKNEITLEDSQPAPEVVHGTFKMKGYYDAGIKAYKAKEYDDALRILAQAVHTKDPHTPRFYYAEAYATIGVIYQFHIIRYKSAYANYKMALKYEPKNPTAKKHLREVAKKLHRKR